MSASFGLGSMSGLDEESWKASSTSERLESLKNLEKVLAERQGRDPCIINNTFLPKNELGKIEPAFPEIMHIQHHLLELNDPKLAVDTVVHEGRHAFQLDCINNPSRHPEIDKQTVGVWEENTFEKYVSPDESFTAYLAQPIEVDAREFAKSVTDTIYPNRSEEIHPALIEPFEGKDIYAFGQSSSQAANSQSTADWSSEMQSIRDSATFKPTSEASKSSLQNKEHSQPSAQTADVDPWVAEQQAVRDSIKFKPAPPPPPEPPAQNKGLSL